MNATKEPVRAHQRWKNGIPYASGEVKQYPLMILIVDSHNPSVRGRAKINAGSHPGLAYVRRFHRTPVAINKSAEKKKDTGRYQ